MSRRFWAVLLLGALLAPSASAFELFGVRIWGGEEEEASGVEILDPLPYEVVTNLDADGLDGQLRGVSQLFQRRDQPASGAAGLIVTAKGDYRRILAQLYTNGYYGGAISIRINGREASTLANTDPVSAPARVELAVERGPRYTFDDILLENPPARYRLGDRGRPGQVGRTLEAGRDARADVIDEVGEEAIELWRGQGHPLAAVGDREVIADHVAQTIDTRITFDPGPKARIGSPEISGSERVKASFIRHMADLEGRESFSPVVLDGARRRLNGLGTFSSVRILEGESVVGDELPTAIEVSDRRPRRFGVGATYSSVDGFGVEGFWLHRNLFGRAERLRFDAELGGIGDTTDLADYDYRLGTSLRLPGFLDPENTLTFSLDAERNVFDIFRERSLEFSLGLERRVSDELTLTGDVGVDFSDVDDELGDRQFLTVYTEGGVIYDRRDNPDDATRGYYLSATARPFYEREFDTTAASMVVEARGFLSFGQTRATVIGARVALGTLAGGTAAELPPSELFFTGGGGAVRGYGFNSIGTRASDDTLGGLSLFEASVEYRQSVGDRFGVVAFADAGQVADERSPFDDLDPRYGVGLGVRFRTGLGPIRLDVATPLAPRNEDPTVAFYVGIGQAF
ncbi:MAG: autotransporter assembly complex family protein [Pseudomonadota bacterium]